MSFETNSHENKAEYSRHGKDKTKGRALSALEII
jgi:hypothetical protein